MRFSKIDDQLSVYKNKNVFIWGAGEDGRRVYEYLQAYQITVVAFVDCDPSKWGKTIGNLNIIPPENLNNFFNVLIQIGSQAYEQEIINIVIGKGFQYVSCTEALHRLSYLSYYEIFKKDRAFYQLYINSIFNYKNDAWDLLLSPRAKMVTEIIICLMPPKVGNWSIYNTLTANLNQNTMVIEVWHCWKLANQLLGFIREYYKNVKIKFVTGVRLPIEQNLSFIYQHICGFTLVDQEFMWKNGGDPEQALDFCVRKHREKISEVTCFYDYYILKRGKHYLIQNFFEEEYDKRLNLNLMLQSFDAERGYDIVKIGDVEVFIYQLEKLNSVVPQLLKYTGVENCGEISKANTSEQKFYYEYYQRTKKEILLPKDYFEWSVNVPYFKHFYSQKDIALEKEKWEKRLK